MKISLYVPAVLLGLCAFTACQDDLEDVENRVYDNGALTPSQVLVDGTFDELVQSFTINCANPAEKEFTVTYGVDLSMVKTYNDIFGASAVALPAENYSVEQPVATFIEGAQTSTAVEVKVMNLGDLDRETVYVLPITVKSAGMEVLESMRTRYIVVRGASLVNVVCNLNENYCQLASPSNATGLGGITALTVQALVKFDEFGKLISTICGIEGNFLLRIGDAGLPDNQLQLATSNGNVTDASWQFKTGVWYRMTFTFDASTGQATLYLDGNKKAVLTSSYRRAVNWNSSSFYVGKSYDDNRYLDGCISELRVWNRILSDAEISNPTQAYTVPYDSEGLVSYWKYNEGAGTLIHDYANGYDLNCNAAPTWVEVSLPEK